MRTTAAQHARPRGQSRSGRAYDENTSFISAGWIEPHTFCARKRAPNGYGSDDRNEPNADTARLPIVRPQKNGRHIHPIRSAAIGDRALFQSFLSLMTNTAISATTGNTDPSATQPSMDRPRTDATSPVNIEISSQIITQIIVITKSRTYRNAFGFNCQKVGGRNS
jgi:hypothetical protein